jgi:hypothetical protein
MFLMDDAASWDLYRRTLERAADLLGGPQRLARYLRAPGAQVFRWLKGEEKPPLSVFLTCVDLVLEDKRMSVTQLFWNADSAPRDGKS